MGLTALAMLCFAANSLLCRLALADANADPASFTAIRLAAGALTLAAIAFWRTAARREIINAGSWSGAAALFAYAAAFSFAYVSLGASVGALILFGAVQATMIATGLVRGERMSALQVCGALLAACGLVYLLLPGLSAPSPHGSALMAAAGIAWGAYSLIGSNARNKTRDPTLTTAGNFLRAAPMGLLLLLPFATQLAVDWRGAALAVASGALASGMGYAIWYAALKGLRASEAAIVQLTVPVIAAAGGALLLQETLTLRFALAAAAVLGGVGLVLSAKAKT